MPEKVSDLTTEQLKTLIADAVRESLEEVIEDIIALSSPSYLQSIEQARNDYKEGRVKELDEVIDV